MQTVWKLVPGLALVLMIFLTGGPSAGSQVRALYCDSAGPMITSRDGQSGRRYECYSLRSIPRLRIGQAEILCDEAGSMITTETGRSGRQYLCYSFRPIRALRAGTSEIHCDIAEKRTGASIGRSGYQYPCYTLKPLRGLRIN